MAFVVSAGNTTRARTGESTTPNMRCGRITSAAGLCLLIGTSVATGVVAHAATSLAAGPAVPPTGLLVDLLPDPAMGVTLNPRFTWVVPPVSKRLLLAGQPPLAHQTSYRIVVSAEVSGEVMWDSEQVQSNQSVSVPYGGRNGTSSNLARAASYQWNVTSWPAGTTGSGIFVCGIAGNWNHNTVYLGTGNTSVLDRNAQTYYTFFRNDVAVPPGVQRATIFAAGDYKLYINGVLASIGPGPAAPSVRGGHGDGNLSLGVAAYATIDVTEHVKGVQHIAIAVESAIKMFMMELHLGLEHEVSVIAATNITSTWMAFDAVDYYNPTPASNSKYTPVISKGIGQGGLEFIDARFEPVGWKLPATSVRDLPGWHPANYSKAVQGPRADGTCTSWCLLPRMAPPTEIFEIGAVVLEPIPGSSGHDYFIDFGREFQGGLRVNVTAAAAGHRVQVLTAEAHNGTSISVNTWGFNWTWTLREGFQVLEMYKYCEFRYARMEFLDDAPSAGSVAVGAWGFNHAWNAADTHFESSNSMLNRVWEQSRYTQQAGVLDHFTDSNTRERTGYEADTLIASIARGYLQRDYTLQRHSFASVLLHPTWPVEWQLESPLMAWQDFWATGDVDFVRAFGDVLISRLRIEYIDSTGLANTSRWYNYSGRFGVEGNHLVDWQCPGPGAGVHTCPNVSMFTPSDYITVDQALMLSGLQKLTRMYSAAGLLRNATNAATVASKLHAAMMSKQWDASTKRFCDGICADKNVSGHSSVDTDMFTLWLDAVPEQAASGVWKQIASWPDLEGIGVYGAFAFISALAHPSASDDGSAMVHILTQCSNRSWCKEIEDYNATMTMEDWSPSPWMTYSHPWGTSPIIGVVNGIIGLRQTGEAFSTFEVKPKLGNLSFVHIRVPTIRGHIEVNASTTESGGSVSVTIPCNSLATLCVPHGLGRKSADAAPLLSLDGAAIKGKVDGNHLCVPNYLGCAADAAARVLSFTVG